MLSRRDCLRTGILISAGALSGCGSAAPQYPTIRILRQSVPGSLLGEFKRNLSVLIGVEQVASRPELFQPLETGSAPPSPNRWNPGTWFTQPAPPTVLTLLSSDWVTRAIASNWIQPFEPSDVSESWDRIPAPWQRVVRRVEDESIWGIPWQWGLTAIAYNRKYIQEPIQDWADLWRSELAQRLTVPDHPREVIGLTLKKLGGSYNQRVSLEDTDLRRELGSLHQQVLAYTSDEYLQMLRIEDAWVAVGWTEDLFELQRNYSDFEVVLPRSGSALWWDVWVVPTQMNSSPFQDPDLATAINQWLDLVVNPETASRIVDRNRIAHVLPVDPETLAPRLQGRPDLHTDPFDLGEAWEPLSEEQAIVYLELWQQMRQDQLGSTS